MPAVRIRLRPHDYTLKVGCAFQFAFKFKRVDAAFRIKVVMNRYNNAGAQPACRNQRLVDVHVGAAADGNKRDVWFVYFAHQLEILLQGGVAEVINFDAADIQQNAGRLSERSSVGQKTAVHGITELCRTPWILPGAADGYLNCFGTLFGTVFCQLRNRGNLSLIVLGNFDGVA